MATRPLVGGAHGPDSSLTGDERASVLRLLEAYGTDVTSFQVLEPGYHYLFAADSVVAYFEAGAAWVAAGRPIGPESRQGEAVAAFQQAALCARKRPSFFAVPSSFGEEQRLRMQAIGMQAYWQPQQWEATLKADASLRYQLRRAHRKGVRVRQVPPSELQPGSELRRAIETLARDTKGRRPLAPMGFLVELDLFGHCEERRYWVAERSQQLVGFAIAVPIFREQGWLVEDLLRTTIAPNGTTESLIDSAMRQAAAERRSFVSLGLAPLAGEVGTALKLVRSATAALFDFEGLYRFKRKLRPQRWQTLYVATSEHPQRALLDVLRAFARGSFVRFGLQTLIRGPALLLWALTAALIVWTPLLAIAPAAWFPAPWVKLAWVTFDVLLAAALVFVCARPRAATARLLTFVVLVDAVVTLTQAIFFNLRSDPPPVELLLLALACLAPWLGALVLRGAAKRLMLKEDGSSKEEPNEVPATL